METRYMMTNMKRGTHIEESHTPAGKKSLEAIRRHFNEWRGCHIVSAVQAFPSRVKTGYVYRRR